MKILILADVDENHLAKETNELFDRLKGYKCELKPVPERKAKTLDKCKSNGEWFRLQGWDDCVNEILGEEE